jgi:diphthamide synthase subunit DPH2
MKCRHITDDSELGKSLNLPNSIAIYLITTREFIKYSEQVCAMLGNKRHIEMVAKNREEFYWDTAVSGNWSYFIYCTDSLENNWAVFLVCWTVEAYSSLKLLVEEIIY